jgi:hypothetical protein
LNTKIVVNFLSFLLVNRPLVFKVDCDAETVLDRSTTRVKPQIWGTR